MLNESYSLRIGLQFQFAMFDAENGHAHAENSIDYHRSKRTSNVTRV